VTIGAETLRARTQSLGPGLARFLPAFVLAGYGIFILSLFARQALTLYINPSYVAPATIAAAVLIGLAAVKVRRAEGEACCEDACDCEQPPRLWVYVLLCIPLLLAALFPPRGLDASAALQRGAQVAGMSQIHGSSTVSRASLSVDTASFSIQDWAGALSADPNPSDYKGKPVSLSGIVLHNSAAVPPGYIMVIRYQVTCCIADARPVGLVVKDTSHGALLDNQWVRVTGIMGETGYQGQKIAVVIPKTLAPTKAGDPYMY
jgi:putative membrane protein